MLSSKAIFATTATLTILPQISAWGSLGHQTVAYLAQHYVSNTTTVWAQTLLNDTSTSYLANIATWADSYRYTFEGSFSSPFHYIDALDNPPETCNVDFERDCTVSGCIVSAIANYTERVQAFSSELDLLQRNYALRWIVHFIGDLSQPLHVENYEVGGNGVHVTFQGVETNLHAVWDTSIPEELRGGVDGLEGAAAWAENLAVEIESGEFVGMTGAWLEGIELEDPVGTAMGWASDANAFVCSVVMPEGGEVLNGTELYPEYYESAVRTVEGQIAKAGVRLAKWLDLIAEGQEVVRGYEKRGRKVEIKRSEELNGRQWLPKSEGDLNAQRVRREMIGDGCGCTH